MSSRSRTRPRHTHRGFLAGVLLIAQVACSTDQQADIDHYRSISDPPPDGGHSALDQPAFSLADALRQTALVNERLAIQGEKYIQALAARQNAAASLRPTISLFSGTALRENTGSGPVAESDIGVNGQYRVLTGLGDLRNVEASESVIRSREWLILDLREALLLQTARAYYEALRADRLIAVLESSVNVQLERFRDAQARNTVGFARPLDVAQIEAQVSRTRTQLIDARRAALEARSTLRLLTGVDAALLPLSDGFDAPAQTPAQDDLLRGAWAHRQDVLSARNEADAARLLVDAAIGGYAPTITLNLDYFLLRAPDDGLPMIAGLIQARVPVFSAGRIEADVRSSWSVFRERVLEYQLRSREVRRDVETARAQVEASRTRLDELRTQVEVARQSLALAEASYQVGLGTNLDRIQAQDVLLSAQLQATSEEFVLKTSWLALRRACGVLSSELICTPLPNASDHELTAPDAPLLDRSPR